MKWIEPAKGETRMRFAFLLFPKTLNGETRWLCFARWEERYVPAMIPIMPFARLGGWAWGHWID